MDRELSHSSYTFMPDRPPRLRDLSLTTEKISNSRGTTLFLDERHLQSRDDKLMAWLLMYAQIFTPPEPCIWKFDGRAEPSQFLQHHHHPLETFRECFSALSGVI